MHIEKTGARDMSRSSSSPNPHQLTAHEMYADALHRLSGESFATVTISHIIAVSHSRS